MGIDPLTHKPLSNTIEQIQNQIQQPPLEQQQQQQQPLTFDVDSKFDEENKEKETETSLESSTNDLVKENGKEEILTPLLFDSLELVDGFCIDEVPMIEPNEILVSSSNSSSTTSSSSSSNSTNFLEDLELLPDFELFCNYNENNNNSNNNMDFWDDDFIRSLNLVISENDDKGDRKQQEFDAPFKMVMDSESWAFGLF